MYYAGVDFGTSGCRLMIIDQHSDLRYEARILYPNKVYQSAELWWQSLTQLCTNIPSDIAAQLQAISIDGTSGSLLLSDHKGKPTSPVMMYNNTQAIQEAATIAMIAPDNSGAHGVGGSLSKLLFLLQQYPNSEHCHALHQADWIANRLLDQWGYSDENNCLKLGYDPVTRQWPKWLSQLDVPVNSLSNLLPKVSATGQCLGTISAKIAQELHVPLQLKIVAGTTDSIAAFIATGANKIGDAVSSLGSTLAIKMLVDQPIYAPKMGIYSHRLANNWLVGGASNTGGAVLLKYFDKAQLASFTQQLNPAKLLHLHYYPLAQKGERFPIADSNKQPMLNPRPSSDAEFFQAMLEGMADIETTAYQCLRQLGAVQARQIYTVGGGGRNEKWTIIRQNKLGVTLKTPVHSEAAYGSALLAKGLRY
jgi:sugar (pentulose or hexulose) kinase